jgi:hypothetical protein
LQDDSQFIGLYYTGVNVYAIIATFFFVVLTLFADALLHLLFVDRVHKNKKKPPARLHLAH